MTLFRGSMPVCPRDKHCSRWAQKHMRYCLCSVRGGVSLTLGIISVISWGVAEVPQIITNYREKSTEGLSITFLTTWMIGDLFNLFGCIMEPATLPTQFYMALMYTLTTALLFAQSIYYAHVYPQLKSRRNQMEADERQTEGEEKPIPKQRRSVDRRRSGAHSFHEGQTLSSPIPLPQGHRNSFSGRELYYTSARSLSSSHTPPAGSYLAQRMTPPARNGSFLEEPFMRGQTSPRAASPPAAKTMLCLVSAFMFLGTWNLPNLQNVSRNMVGGQRNQAFVVQVTRKLLQVGSEHLEESFIGESGGIGMLLGWAMAAIYMGGRLPQICLNMRRGNVEGLNPLMFFFALLGNSTYVASILVNSVEWSKIRPNLPWLVDAGGCVLLDTFILLQFIYFHYHSNPDSVDKHETTYVA